MQSHSSSLYFKHTSTTQIYTLSLHDALPIWWLPRSRNPESTYKYPEDGWNSQKCSSTSPLWLPVASPETTASTAWEKRHCCPRRDRKSTRLNSSHLVISYAVFCLKKKI